MHPLQFHCPAPLKASVFSKVLPSSPNSSTELETRCWRSPNVTFHASNFSSTSDLAPIVCEPMDVSSISALGRTQQRLLSGLNGALSLARMQGTFRSIFTSARLPGAASQPGLCKRKKAKINKHMLQWDFECRVQACNKHMRRVCGTQIQLLLKALGTG
ncbi:hypothetical protein QQF64_030912 [Cirrhinus molitorella]|uniref:Uncharacterized protein n=1 Tax=Cirrhinus molitorella TaxID=172907 RepID=A0ABR3N510_9TELE